MSRALLVATLLLTGCRSVVLSAYGTRTGLGREHGGNPEFRRQAHRGVDFRADQRGAPVLAAADGFVLEVRAPTGNNVSVLIGHLEYDRWTRYDYRGTAAVAVGELVERGQPIGAVAAQPTKGDGLAFVHLELCTAATCTGSGALGGTEDPLANSDGCYQRDRRYPRDHLVLTHPVGC